MSAVYTLLHERQSCFKCVFEIKEELNTPFKLEHTNQEMHSDQDTQHPRLLLPHNHSGTPTPLSAL